MYNDTNTQRELQRVSAKLARMHEFQQRLVGRRDSLVRRLSDVEGADRKRAVLRQA